jgi:hypothetical protein
MSRSAGFGPLVATACGALLLASSCRPTFAAAIALTTVTAAAHKEQHSTIGAATEPLAQWSLGRRRRDFGAHLITIPWIADDRLRIAPAARMMSTFARPGGKLRKLRFQMTDNILPCATPAHRNPTLSFRVS